MIVEYIYQVFVSSMNIATMWMAGNKHKDTWLFAIGTQLSWLVLIVWQHLWGILPFNLFMWYISIRNHIKWRREHKENERNRSN